MKIRADCKDGILRVRLLGELDHHAAAGTLREIDGLLDRFLPRDCALDLSGLAFMDSSGIALILRLHKRMEALGGRLLVMDPAEQPLRVLDASGIDRLVRVVCTMKEVVI